MLTPVWNYSFPGWKWVTQTRKHLMLKSIFYIQRALKLHKMLLPQAIFVFWDCSSNPQVFPSGLGAAACSLGMKNSRKSSETLLQWHTFSSKDCWFLNSADIKQPPPHGLGTMVCSLDKSQALYRWNLYNPGNHLSPWGQRPHLQNIGNKCTIFAFSSWLQLF